MDRRAEGETGGRTGGWKNGRADGKNVWVKGGRKGWGEEEISEGWISGDMDGCMSHSMSELVSFFPSPQVKCSVYHANLCSNQQSGVGSGQLELLPFIL